MSLKPKVVVVDDEPLLLRVMTRMLEVEVELLVFEAPADFLAYLAGGGPCDAVVSDVHLPGITVNALYSRICILRPDLATRVIFVTGSDAESESETFLGQHADRLLLKPFQSQDLIRLLRRALADH
jgi:CheY-like chemotaxis protein